MSLFLQRNLCKGREGYRREGLPTLVQLSQNHSSLLRFTSPADRGEREATPLSRNARPAQEKGEIEQEEIVERINSSFQARSLPHLDAERQNHADTVVCNNMDYDNNMFISPGDSDVLVTHNGNNTYCSSGNVAYNAICKSVLDDYDKAPQNKKREVVERVMEMIHNQEPPGRFLELRTNGLYKESPKSIVMMKIRRSIYYLRRPDVRKSMMP
jgi:hypothetical protein